MSSKFLSMCISCQQPVRPRQQGLQCESCHRWQHRTCNTGVSQSEYRHAVKTGASIDWRCLTCDCPHDQAESTASSSEIPVSAHPDDDFNSEQNSDQDIIVFEEFNPPVDWFDQLTEPLAILTTEETNAESAIGSTVYEPPHEPTIDEYTIEGPTPHSIGQADQILTFQIMEQHERCNEEILSTERPLTLTDPTQTPENQNNGGRMLNISASMSSLSTSMCSSTPSSLTPPTVTELIPRSDPDSQNRCLEPLNLASMLNRVCSSVEMSNSLRIDNLMQRLETLETQNQLFQEQMAQRQENLAPKAPKHLPKELLANVREVYATLTGPDGKELKWNLYMRFSELTNRTVSAAVLDGVRRRDTSSPISTIKAAMRAHFHTKKKQKKVLDSNLQNEVLKNQRKRSRKNMKKTKRAKVLRESTNFSNVDKEKYAELMEVGYMSSEESLSGPESEEHRGETSDLDEDIPNKKCLRVRPLSWRSNEVNILMTQLDRKIARRQSQHAKSMVMERIVGQPSLREAPDNAPRFALASTS